MINNNICLTGVTASGKSSVCKEVIKHFPEISLFSKSHQILATAAREFGINHRDSIKTLNQKDLKYLFEIVEEESRFRLCQPEIYLIDDHLRVLSQGNHWIEAQENYTANHFIGCYIILLPCPDRVLKNQSEDKNIRYRTKRCISDIRNEQLALKQLILRWNFSNSFDYHFVTDNDFFNAVERVKKVIDEWIRTRN